VGSDVSIQIVHGNERFNAEVTFILRAIPVPHLQIEKRRITALLTTSLKKVNKRNNLRYNALNAILVRKALSESSDQKSNLIFVVSLTVIN